ncbi:MAG: hypothetical protein E7354_04590 [Clostridiales bacterium]|nr:hypothetical protein [Clostridiales bacterium]
MTYYPEIHTPHIASEKMDELLSIATGTPVFTASGSNSKCFISGDYAVLKTSNIEGHTHNFDEIIEDLNDLSNNGVNVVRILGYAITEYGKPYYNGHRYDSGFIVQEKAPGRELLDPHKVPVSFDPARNNPENRQYVLDYCTMLREAPQEHFDKFMSDLRKITDRKIMVDPSKLTNFFYDPEKGFSFIDLNFRTQEKLFDVADIECNQTHRPFLHTAFAMIKEFPLEDYNTGTPLYAPEEAEHIKTSMCLTFEKLSAAANKIGILPEDIADYFRDQSNPQCADSGFSLYEFTSPENISGYLSTHTM